MIRRMARYKIEHRWLDEVQSIKRTFVKSINESEPSTRYVAYQEDGGDWFTHLMTFSDREAEDRHRNAVYTTRFVEQLYPKCDIRPEFHDLDVVAETG